MRGDRREGGHGHRPDRLAEQIRGEVSQIIGYELSDDRIGFATVTDVRVSPDLATAHVYVSFLGEDDDRQKSLDALTQATGFIRRLLAPRLRTKRAVALKFHLDDLLDKGNRIEDLLKEDGA